MFDKYSIHFLETLRKQQEDLKNRGTPRRVLLLFDDVEVDSETASTLGFFASRHRHFDVSMAYCSVRYSNVHKTYRASTDALLLFSTPMASDRKLMLLEYAQSPRFASFCMQDLQKHQSLVFMSGFKQELYRFRIQDDLHNFQGNFGTGCLEGTEDDTQEVLPAETVGLQNSNVDRESKTETEELLQGVSAEDNRCVSEQPNSVIHFE
jgi:hypothetical protein